MKYASRYDTSDHLGCVLEPSDRAINFGNAGSGGRLDENVRRICHCGKPAETGFRQCTKHENESRILAHLAPREINRLSCGERKLFSA